MNKPTQLRLQIHRPSVQSPIRLIMALAVAISLLLVATDLREHTTSRSLEAQLAAERSKFRAVSGRHQSARNNLGTLRKSLTEALTSFALANASASNSSANLRNQMEMMVKTMQHSSALQRKVAWQTSRIDTLMNGNQKRSASFDAEISRMRAVGRRKDALISGLRFKLRSARERFASLRHHLTASLMTMEDDGGASVRLTQAACSRKTAYAALLTKHSTIVGRATITSRYLNSSGSRAKNQSLRRQVQLITVLVRATRLLDRCRRDFILLLGDAVSLTLGQTTVLQQEGVILHRIRPLFPGVPTGDKFHAWRLVDYDKVVFIDSDVMPTAPLDELFEREEELTIAHHPYDTLQGQCGIPHARRGVAALFAFRPSEETFTRLVQFSRENFKPQQRLYIDQTGLMCLFGNRSKTLPCGYLNDAGMPPLRKFQNSCLQWGASNMIDNCIIGKGCAKWATKANAFTECKAVSQHLQHRCSSDMQATNMRAVHFKGGMKPWRFRQTHRECSYLSNGLPLVQDAGGDWVPVGLTDQLRWKTLNSSTHPPSGDNQSALCISHEHGRPISWAGNLGLVLSRSCCNMAIIRSAEWLSLLNHPEGSQAQLFADKAPL